MRNLLPPAVCAVALLALSPLCRAEDRLEVGFRNPPASARPHTWWHWMNGNVTKEGITADLEAMKRVGIGGAQLFHVDLGLPNGKVPYMSAQWREMVVHAAKEAKRLGLELCLHNCAGWSSSGGPWIRPEHAMQALTWSETTARGPMRFSDALPTPPHRLTYEHRVDYYRDIAVLAFRTPAGEAGTWRIPQINGKAGFGGPVPPLPAQFPPAPGPAIAREAVLNLTDRLEADGRLTWDVPEGEWTILRIGHRPTGKDNHPAPPEGRGLECDKLSREAMDAHWNGIMAKVIADLGPLAGTVLNNALIDSYEVGNQNWTPKMREEFQRRRGYDLLPLLPVITGRVVESLEVSERFLWDFRRTLADLCADNYYGYFAELCRRHGMKFSTEPYYSDLFDNLQVGGLADIPMGEFWIEGGAIESTKLAASAAHTHGRQIVGAESFTTALPGWSSDPFSFKALGDLAFCNGINRYIFHRYAHQPWLDLKPGMTMGPFGLQLERTITWWNQAATWLRYVARCQYLLQSGRFVADICYFYGEGVPNDLPPNWASRLALPRGYDYDGCDTTALLQRMTVRNGRIVLPDGVEYRLLVLPPDSAYMTPTVLRKVRELVRAGATVIGPKPQKSPSLSGYPACDEEVRQLAEEVWGDCDGQRVKEHRFGQGRVVWGQTLQEVLAGMGLPPDFSYRSLYGPAQVLSIHRRTGGADIYFVSNQKYRAVEIEGAFRVSGRVPEVWHPDTGRIETAPVYREEGGRTFIPLRLDPAGSVFVVFRRPTGGRDHLVSVARLAPDAPPPAPPRVEIRKAFYEPQDGRPGGADVTARVAALVAEGQYEIPATNAVFGDPTPNVVKRLRVEYTVNGQPMQKVVGENGTLELVEAQGVPDLFEITSAGSGAATLSPWQAGVYEARTAQGRTMRVEVREAAKRLELSGPWTLRFPPGGGAPGQVTLERLISWPEHSDPGVRYFSGTAEYLMTLDVPAEMVGRGRRLALDLGQVKNFAEVTLNGRNLGVLWKAPFRLDVTGLVKPGRNTLSVKVTNLWPNRLIGDAQQPEEVEWNGDVIKAWPSWLAEGRPRPPSQRLTFTTWRFHKKDSPLLESGLLGPVSLRSARPVPLPKPKS